MSHRHAAHAHHVVEAFEAMLSESGRQHVGTRHFEELAILIESAIEAALVQEMEATADMLEKMSHDIRLSAEHFERPDKPD